MASCLSVRSDGCFMATAATVSPTPTAEPRKPAQGLREARAGMTKRRTRRTKIAALLSASALVVLDAACPLYVLGGSGERREASGRERQAAGAPGSGRRDERGRRSPFVLVPRRPR